MCWGPNGPRQIIAMQPLIKEFKCFFNYKLNVKTGFLDPENMGKDTKSDFLSQISCSFDSDSHFMFCLYDRKVAQGCWSGTFLILIHMICQVNNVKFDM